VRIPHAWGKAPRRRFLPTSAGPERFSRPSEAISDKAEALRAYGRQANDHELETWAAEIKVRAQRRIGELTRELETSPGKRTDKPSPPSGRGSTQTKEEALEAAGLSKQTASRCEQLAAIPEEPSDAEAN
jgi:hypothetical protein